MSSKPTIILVPGAWHKPHMYKALTSDLESHGYKVVTIDLASVTDDTVDPVPSHDADKQLVAKAIKAEVDAGNEVAVLVHSYGGVPGADAIQGFEGSVVRLVYLCAFVVDVGGSLFGMLGGQWLPWMRPDGKYIHADDSENIFYNDVMDQDVIQANKAKLLLHSPGAFKGEVGFAAFKHVPSVYIMCEKDNAIPLPIQEQMASQEGKWVMDHIRVDAGHVPFLAKPEETTAAILKALS